MRELDRLEKIAGKCLAKSVAARAQKNHRMAAAWERGRKFYARKMAVEILLTLPKN